MKSWWWFPTAVALLAVYRSPRPVGSADTAHAKAVAPEPRTDAAAAPARSPKSAASGDAAGNGTTPCDRYLRSAEVEMRNPRNHKFVTSNGWTDRHRPRPEINVYSRIEELPSSPSPPPPPTGSAAGVATYYQQQRDNFYQHSRQQLQPTVRTSKRIIYYATLPDVVRTPVGYQPPVPGYPSDPFALGPGPYSADFRQVDPNRNNGPSSADHSQRNRVAPYENAYNRGGTGVTSVTSKSTAVYNSRYDEPAEFRDSYYRPNEFASKFASWAEPFYKSWTSSSSSWDRDPTTRFSNRDSSPFPWDREPLGNSLWDANRGSSWDKELVEVPLQKPNGGGGGNGRVRGDGDVADNKYEPEVTVVQSGVIDVRGDRRQNVSPPSPPPPGRFTIIDVDPKPYRPEHELSAMRYDERGYPMTVHHQQRPQPAHHQPYDAPMPMRYDPQQKPMRYETYTPMQPPARYEHDDAQRFEQQYRAPQSPSAQQQYGQQNQNRRPSNNDNNNNGYYETVKNNVNTHQFMTSWTEVSTQNDVSPTQSVSLDISSLGNSTSVHNNTRIVPYTNSTKTPPK